MIRKVIATMTSGFQHKPATKKMVDSESFNEFVNLLHLVISRLNYDSQCFSNPLVCGTLANGLAKLVSYKPENVNTDDFEVECLKLALTQLEFDNDFIHISLNLWIVQRQGPQRASLQD